jgi:hypothetical protein
MPRAFYRAAAGAAPAKAPDAKAMRDAIAPLPGTRAIAFAATAPGFGGSSVEVAIPDRPPLVVETNDVSPGFFSAIDLPIVRGRALDDRDGPCRAGGCSAVVSEALARRLFPAGDAVGGSLQTTTGTRLRIVGVAADTSAQTAGEPDRPALYRPWTPDGRAYQALVRFDGDPGTFAARVGAELRARFPQASVDTHTLRWPLDVWLDEMGRVEQLVVALGVAAAALAAMGVFGVVSFAVSRREREFGIRIALGATRAQIYAAVMSSGWRPVAAGFALGTGGALLTGVSFARVLAKVRFTVSPLAPGLYLCAALPLAIVIAAGLIVPARRAMSVDPIRTLKDE